MKTILVLTFSIIFSLTAQSQDAVAISGGEAIGSGGTSSYTLGHALGTYMILNPQKAQASSPADNPGSGF